MTTKCTALKCTITFIIIIIFQKPNETKSHGPIHRKSSQDTTKNTRSHMTTKWRIHSVVAVATRISVVQQVWRLCFLLRLLHFLQSGEVGGGACSRSKFTGRVIGGGSARPTSWPTSRWGGSTFHVLGRWVTQRAGISQWVGRKPATWAAAVAQKQNKIDFNAIALTFRWFQRLDDFNFISYFNISCVSLLCEKNVSTSLSFPFTNDWMSRILIQSCQCLQFSFELNLLKILTSLGFTRLSTLNFPVI